MSVVNFPDAPDFSGRPRIGAGNLINKETHLVPALGVWESPIFFVGDAQAVLIQHQFTAAPNNEVFAVQWGQTPGSLSLDTTQWYYHENDVAPHFDVLTPVAPYFALFCTDQSGSPQTLTVSCSLIPYLQGNLLAYKDHVMLQDSVSATTGTVFNKSLNWQRPGPAIMSLYGPSGPANLALMAFNPNTGTFQPVGALELSTSTHIANQERVIVPNNTCTLQFQQTSGATGIVYYALTAE